MLITDHPDIVHNKYFKWYLRIVRFNQIQSPVFPYEVHHILPRSMGGTNEPSNLVKLPLRCHYVVHLLLWKCTRSISYYRMAQAVTTMKARSCVIINSRLYEKAKLISSAQSSIRNRGMFSAVDSSGGRHYIMNTDPRFLSGELISASKGRLAGLKYSDDHRRNIAAAKTTTKNPNHKWYICTPLGSFDSLGDAAKVHDTSRTTVLNRCNSLKFPDWSKSSTPNPETH